ncbi:MAG: Ig-like domain-containing protein [Candidatus Binatia bacterium]
MIAAPVWGAEEWTLIGWNNLGMHCMDPDYGVFALLPPYNTLQAQLIDPSGRLVQDPAGITVTYAATADPSGSINRSSIGKTNFWQHVLALFGVAPELDVGLAGSAMPGTANAPQPMPYDAANGWFIAAGIPITPIDDAGGKNSYPLMRLVARDAGGAELARTDVVLPVSDELNCKACHSSGGSPAAQPFNGWVNDPDPERDVRLNILLLHDDFHIGTPAFDAALSAAGYEPGGLTATLDARGPILCARCHASEALPGSGVAGVSSLTRAIHHRMAGVADPLTGMALDAADNRSACYRCHPGSITRCLRGAMGGAVAADGSLAMQCQSCHGRMVDVAKPERTGWLDEPVCQSCHTGTALHNNGQLRYTTVFEADGTLRLPVDDTFATTPDVPLPGKSLYRFSTGHGGLQCEACHGATHAEYPSTQANDNLQSEQIQGHAGVLVECTACHASAPLTVDGGPHGMHPVGAVWVERHPDAAEEGGAQRCRACHGTDYRGTVLSRVKGERTFDTDFGRKHFWRGFQVGCFTCHLGPDGEEANPNHAPVVDDGNAVSRAAPVDVALGAHDADGDDLSLRIVAQAGHGTVGLSGRTARYFPDEGYIGDDAFTFTASDGSTDGNLGRVVVNVAPVCAGDCGGDGVVSIADLIHAVAIALGNQPLAGCAGLDRNGDQRVAITELVGAVNAALSGCDA